MGVKADFEVALLYVREQHVFAESLTRELHRLGASVFCDFFDNAKLRPEIVDLEVHAGLDRSDRVVVFFSKDFLNRAWDRNDRHQLVAEINEQRSDAVSLLRFDDTPIPDK